MQLGWSVMPDNVWWLHESDKLLDSNLYDVVVVCINGRWVILHLDRTGERIKETQVGKPFNSLQDAKDVAEMMHRMGAWL